MAIGSWSMFSAMTTIIGPALGGWLAGIGLWRMIFFINVPLALISLFFLMRVPESKGIRVNKHDISSAILATLALTGITYGFTEAPGFGFDHPYVYGALIAGTLLFVILYYPGGQDDLPTKSDRVRRSLSAPC